MEYFEFLKDVTKEAGEIIRKGYYGEVNVREKSLQDYVTEIDLDVEKKIIEKIKEKFPDHNILAEESGNEKIDSDFEWVIDPLDGTTNFIHKIPMSAISIGLEKVGLTIVGAVYNPITDELFYAEKGKGAYLNGKKLKIESKETHMNEVHGAHGTKFHREIEDWFLAWCYPDPKRNEKSVKKVWEVFYPKCLRVTKLGSAALELAYVAANRVDAYLSIGLKRWDYSAGQLIVEEAGGVFLREKLLGDDLFIAASEENARKIKNEIIN